MLYRDIIELITISGTTQNAKGDDIPNKVYKTVFVNELEIPSSEFYQSMATGIKPLLKYELQYIDYSDEEFIRVGGVGGIEYRVFRTFKKSEKIELTLKSLVI